MVIEFEIRPRDTRVFEAWQQYKYPLSRTQWLTLYFGMVGASVVYGYRHPEYNLFVVLLGFIAVFFAIALALRSFILWRYRKATGLVEGQHSLHFSTAGVHHVGPVGIDRYSWADFAGVDVTVDYLFLRFRDRGTIAIPVTALKRFGTSYDEAFLAELAPLIQVGLERER